MVKPRETTWNDVKTELLQFDRTGLLGLLKDLYVLRPENRAFLAARFGIGSDPLTPFKKVISRWIYPNLIKGQTVSVAKAKKAIADYRKAVGRAEGITELCVFYCEEAARLVGRLRPGRRGVLCGSRAHVRARPDASHRTAY